MKTVLTSGYTFTAASKQLDFSSTSGFNVQKLIAVVNLTRGVIIYAPGVSGKGYSSISGGNVLTLSYDTTSHSDSDTLLVYYETTGAGRAADASSLSVALSTEDVAFIDGIETSLSSLDTKTPALGQALSAASVPVVLPAAQITTLTPPAAITGFATSAKQDTIITSLSNIDAGIPAALGQTTASASMPVVLASDYVQPKSTFLESINTVSSATNVIASTDLSGYKSFSVQMAFTGTATVTFEGSNDNSVWVSLLCSNVANGGLSTTANAAGIYVANATTRYVRVRVSTYSSGNVTATFEAFPFPVVPPMPFGTNTTTFRTQMVSAVDQAIAANTLSGTGVNASVIGMNAYASMVAYNGSTMDVMRSVNAASILASAARTTTQTGSDTTNYNFRGLILYVNVTSAGTGSITPSLDLKDSVSATYKTVWTAASAITTNGLYVYSLASGAVTAASFTEAVQIYLGRTFRISITANNANSVTYSVSMDLLPM